MAEFKDSRTIRKWGIGFICLAENESMCDPTIVGISKTSLGSSFAYMNAKKSGTRLGYTTPP